MFTHQVIVKMEVEALVEVEIDDAALELGPPWQPLTRAWAVQLVERLVNDGRIAADPALYPYMEDMERNPIPDWATVQVVDSANAENSVEQ